MELPISDLGTATTLHTAVETVTAPAVSEPAFVPLDEFLRVDVIARASLRVAVRTFLQEHCARRGGISLIAGRGKLIADLSAIAGQRVTFGEVLKHVTEALAHSELRTIRGLDARELSAQLCLPAIAVR